MDGTLTLVLTRGSIGGRVGSATMWHVAIILDVVLAVLAIAMLGTNDRSHRLVARRDDREAGRSASLESPVDDLLIPMRSTHRGLRALTGAGGGVPPSA
jgi:hypothetical protein